MAWGKRRWRATKQERIDEATALSIRMGILRGLVLLAFLILVAQLWRLQIVEGSYYRQKAEANRLRILTITPQRGVIYDRRGVILARNMPSFTVAVVPLGLPKESRGAVSSRLGKLLGMSPDVIVKLIDDRESQGHLFTPVPIKDGIDRETAFIVEEHRRELPGVVILTEPRRYYPEGPTMAHTLGYVGRISQEELDTLGSKGYELNDKLGKMGLELTYEEILRGKPGKEQAEVDANGRKLRTLATLEPQPGYNLVLSIDLDLQKETAKLLAEGLGESKSGAVVAMNPETGEILAMVSLPSYDNNLFSYPLSEETLANLLKDPRLPLLNGALAGTFPPGSIFKIVTGSAALQERVARPDTRIVSRGVITVPNQYDPSILYYFYDWAILGELDFYRAVAQSSDVYFYYLAGGYQDFNGLGSERLARYARDFSLGGPTGVDLPGEVMGLVPDPNWKENTLGEPWLKGDTYNYGIGQGYVTVTPLQMAQMVATVANGGTLFQPQVVREIVDYNGRKIRPFQKRVLRQVSVSPENLGVVREGMRQAVAWGTATMAQVPNVEVAGKTGTAEFGTPLAGGKEYPTHGWFVGFAPFKNPKIAVAVFLERGNGAKNAAPIAGKIMGYYLKGEVSKAKASLQP